MKYALFLALFIQCDAQPKVVEPAKLIPSPMGAEVSPSMYCADAKRVMLRRQNGEYICVDFDLVDARLPSAGGSFVWPSGPQLMGPIPALRYLPVNGGTITINPASAKP